MKSDKEKAQEMTQALKEFSRIMREEYSVEKSWTEVALQRCESVFESFGNEIVEPFVLIQRYNGKDGEQITNTIKSTRMDWHKFMYWTGKENIDFEVSINQ